jgi:hypothetical protein
MTTNVSSKECCNPINTRSVTFVGTHRACQVEKRGACCSFLFFSGEGPRSRRYGRNAALRLIVQPYNEEWRWLLFFVPFLVMEHRWNETDRGKPKNSGKKPVPVPLCPPQIPHGLTPGSNPGLRGGRSAANRLSIGTAHSCSIYKINFVCQIARELLWCEHTRIIIIKELQKTAILVTAHIVREVLM